jgi:hypothetical protein
MVRVAVFFFKIIKQSKMSTTILSKFQGALVGAVIGDCIGAVFEHLWAETISPDKVKAAVERVEAGEVRVIFIKREKKRGRGMFCSNRFSQHYVTQTRSPLTVELAMATSAP